MQKNDLKTLINKIEEDIKYGSMFQLFLHGIALKVMEDRLWNINIEYAQKCKDLQHRILEK